MPSLRASILAGPDVRVINVARGGVLVESDVRLTPGSGLCLNMAVGDQLYQVAGRVSRVDAALVSGRIKYQAGVALDQEMAIFDLPAPQADGSGASDGQRSDSAAQLAPQEEEADPDDSEFESLRHDLAECRRELEQQREASEALKRALEAGEACRRELQDAQAGTVRGGRTSAAC